MGRFCALDPSGAATSAFTRHLTDAALRISPRHSLSRRRRRRFDPCSRVASGSAPARRRAPEGQLMNSRRICEAAAFVWTTGRCRTRVGGRRVMGGGELLAAGVRAQPAFRMIETSWKITFSGSSPAHVCSLSLCLIQRSLQTRGGRGSERPGLPLLSGSLKASAASLPTLSASCPSSVRGLRRADRRGDVVPRGLLGKKIIIKSSRVFHHWKYLLWEGGF